VPIAEVKGLLSAQGIRLVPDATRGWGPAYHMRGEGLDGGGRPVSGLLGFIGAMTEGFCGDCNRVRIGPDGALRACLGGRSELSLAPLLRRGESEAAIAARIVEALRMKVDPHEMGRTELGPMVRIGG